MSKGLHKKLKNSQIHPIACFFFFIPLQTQPFPLPLYHTFPTFNDPEKESF